MRFDFRSKLIVWIFTITERQYHFGHCHRSIYINSHCSTVPVTSLMMTSYTRTLSVRHKLRSASRCESKENFDYNLLYSYSASTIQNVEVKGSSGRAYRAQHVSVRSSLPKRNEKWSLFAILSTQGESTYRHVIMWIISAFTKSAATSKIPA